MRTVKEIYDYNNPVGVVGPPMLSAYAGEFWEEYIANSAFFDVEFTRRFAGYYFFNALDYKHEKDDTVSMETTFNTFRAQVYNLLLKNDKKYTELWRIHSIEDNEAYELTNNYDMHETFSGTTGNQSAAITGQRTDASIDNIGSQNSSNLDKITGWDSSSENTNTSQDASIGSRQDTRQFTKGQETDTARSAGQEAHTLRRYGNIGVQTIDDMLDKHKKFWITWSFYDIVFDDICKDLLLVGEV